MPGRVRVEKIAPTRTACPHTLRIVAALSATAALLVAPAAHAVFTPVSPPPDVKPSGVGLDISSFAAVGGAWFAITENGGGYLTHDQGGTWQAVSLPADVGSGIDFADGPDGAYVGGRASSGPVLLHVKESGEVERLDLKLPASDGGSIPSPAFDEDGRLWVFLSDFRNSSSDSPHLSLLRLDADHVTVAERLELPVPKPFDAVQSFRFVGGSAYVRYGSTGVLRLDGKRLVAIDGGTACCDSGGFAAGSFLPALAVGRTVIGLHGISVDGGANWGEFWAGGLTLAVEGDAGLLRRGDWILERAGRAFGLTGLAVPSGTTQLHSVPGGIVAVTRSSAPAALYLHRGAVPAAPTVGSPSSYTRKLTGRLNHFRAKAGMPPVVADETLQKAAANHARYLMLNRVKAESRVPALHRETKGKRGFTGDLAPDRCTALGATCSGDVIEAGDELSRPIDDLIASFYHRLALISPTTAAIGAARAGRYVVVVFDERGRRGLGLGPLPYPQGTYDGRLSTVRETPDPRDACTSNRQRLSRVGAAVTFQTPTEEPVALPGAAFIQLHPLPDVLGVSLFRGSRRVPGCGKVSYLRDPLQHMAFIPEGPLRPHTRYRAVARWRINPEAPVRKFAWSFRTR